MESLIKKFEQIKISDDCYLGENLDHENNFLNELGEKIQEKFDETHCSSFFLRKNNEFVCGNETRN